MLFYNEEQNNTSIPNRDLAVATLVPEDEVGSNVQSNIEIYATVVSKDELDDHENIVEGLIERRPSENLLNMTNADKKVRRNFVREDIYKKLGMLKKVNRDLTNERLMRIMATIDENEDEDEDEEFEQVPVVCPDCLTQYLLECEDMPCPQCGEIN
eukprot:CAMPEP_0204827796 /NCGR_PEP_ID=MMETSP1346-20131115/5283_1 /ASSEMBLY_ACC=CAM_ASM_000771 /TAXON_ID=215587 /ORGANISM="Aplanochytrium stocchinoi, Strain GSBS06" /LENGTH=155 /DNA_ID=CAMNT_0051956389 /DNA_START=219 /DNA_END=686 /DNA_ORIENTATION=+